jgi:hypothetical protein
MIYPTLSKSKMPIIENPKYAWMYGLKPEGFWYSKEEPHYPQAEHSDVEHSLKQQILNAYDNLLNEDRFNPHRNESWDTNEHVITYRGSSWCRCCTKEQQFNQETRKILISMGSRQYVLNGWEWPEGYRHYIDVHNIVPSKEWLENVLNIY